MKKIIQELNPYIPEKPLQQLQEELGLEKIVRLSANENPYGTSPKVKEAILNWNYDLSNRYPDSSAQELRNLVAEKFSLDPSQIVFGVGLDEVIVMLSRVFLQPGDEELVSVPTFSEYALHAEIEEAVIKEVATKEDGQIDFSALLKNITAKTKLVWLCNPNNPTGTYETVSSIEGFIKRVPKETMVLVDEAYIDFVTEENPTTAMNLTKKYPNIVVMRTFSKAYGLANFRVGYAVFSNQIAGEVQKVRLPYNVSSIAQTAAIAAFKDQSFVDEVVAKNAIERAKYEELFQKLGLKFYHSQANFIFFKADSAQELAQVLLKNGYLIRTGLRPSWLRLSIGTPDDNLKIQKIITDFFAING